MVSLVRDGVISPLELVDAHLRQIARRNPKVNAFVQVFDEAAREEACRLSRGEWRGLLHGIPVTVKDSFDIAGQPTRTGCLSRPEAPALEDAPVVARLRDAGAVIIGRTNTSELLRDYECDNPITGRTNNPWDLTRTPGGSSGGEAAAIAAYCSAGGIASDGGGSIRIPAHFCGIAGLKPTPGRIPGAGHCPSLGYPAGLVTTVGPLARTVHGSAAAFQRAGGLRRGGPFSVPAPLREPRLSATRIGCMGAVLQVPVHEDIAQALSRAAGMLDAQGFIVDAFEPEGLERAPNVWAFLFGQWAAAPEQFNGAQILAQPCRPRPLARAVSAADGRCHCDCPAGVRHHRFPPRRAKVAGGRTRDRHFSDGDAGAYRQCAGIAGGNAAYDAIRRRPARGDPTDGPALRRRTAARNRLAAGRSARSLDARRRIVEMMLKISVLLACAATAFAAQPRKIFPYSYTQEDLPNGLRLITVPTDFAEHRGDATSWCRPGRAMRWSRATPVSRTSSST